MLTSLHLHEKNREVCIKARSTNTSLACIHGQVTKHTTVKWPIVNNLEKIFISLCFCAEMLKQFSSKRKDYCHRVFLQHGVLIAQPAKSKSLVKLLKESVCRNFAD